MIHEGKSVNIAQALEERLADAQRNPEDYRVRWMSAVTLGRMRAANQLPALRRFYPALKPSLDQVNNACGWAIQQLTGEPMPPPGEILVPGEHFDNWLQSRDFPNGSPRRK